jgi:hypothetical protein
LSRGFKIEGLGQGFPEKLQSLETGFGTRKWGWLEAVQTVGEPPDSTWTFLPGYSGASHWWLQPVAKVQVSREGHVQGVVLEDSLEVRSRVVLSSASPQVTFLKLVPQVSRV